MMNSISKTILLITALFITGCVSVKKEYLISKNLHIQELEKQDHKFCSSLDLELNQKDTSKSRLYWRCRLSMAKYKLLVNPTPAQSKYNDEIRSLITSIAAKVTDTPESQLLKQNQKIDNRHHQKCVNMGFYYDDKDKVKTDDYFACRRALIDEQQVIPPFGNPEYLNHLNNSYNIGLVIDIRVDNAIRLYKDAEKEYPTCIKFYNKKESFKSCINAQIAAKKCFSEIDKKHYKRELGQKITCQKRSYLQFPETLLIKENKAAEELEKKNIDANRINKHDFASIGINDIDKFYGDKKALENKKKTEKTKTEINSKTGLYTKFELTSLRQDYIAECQKETNDEIKEYVELLNDSCKRMLAYSEQ